MQNTQYLFANDIETQLIEHANNIYHNLGIKRWIDEISIFKKASTYFQICLTIFPDCNIHLFRIDSDPNLSQSSKIQALLLYLSTLLKSDLSHISGEEIINGNLKHITNMLKLLEELSSDLVQSSECSVQSARQHRSSSSEGSKSSYYTVMAIKRQFQKDSNPDDVSSQGQIKSNIKNRKVGRIRLNDKEKDHEHRYQEKSSNSSAGFPIKSKQRAIIPRKTSKKASGQQQNRPSSINMRKILKSGIKAEQKYHHQNHQFINMVKKIHESEYELMENCNNQMQKMYNNVFKEQQTMSKRSKKMIEKQAQLRKKAFQKRLTERNQMLTSLQGDKYLKKAVKNLYRQEEQLKNEVRQKGQNRELRRIKDLMNFNEFDDLFKTAIESNISKRTIHKNK